jgi:hypothetical protein
MSQQSIFGLIRGKVGARPGESCYRLSASTGVMAAGMAASGVVFAMRPAIPQDDTTFRGFIERIRLQFTCITAFAVPITAGRALAIGGVQTGGANFTGGTVVEPCGKGRETVDSVFSNVGFTTPGQVMIANTAALGGVTPQLSPRLATLSLAAAGTSGAVVDKTFDFTGANTAPIDLLGSNDLGLLTIYAPQAMDAGGTWELVVEVDTNELPRNLAKPAY